MNQRAGSVRKNPSEQQSDTKRKRESARLPLFSTAWGRVYFFGGAITSLADFATRNFTTVLALILMASPVCGLRPMRALRSAFTRRPIPGITNTPLFLVSLMAVSASRSRKAADCLLVSSSFSARSRVRAVLVSPDAIECSPSRRALGAACLVGFRATTLTARGRANQITECAKTLYSCGYEEPCRWLPCGLGRYKVNGKMRDFHSFLGFLWV